ncbi:type II secretion system F family protein [Tenuibacillus multivorans]|uniref:Type IV pilus assembly protein PilC n=1 Tax=Tenuibacillus multivorans TaxID=237069 RepID=A0A1H0FZI0_9BACI|nr:type II secretion system F family protein [Tenuibacillus multivorans]GEL78144.1 secretion system protein [Tenuibacillus multivorans]SDO00045.1 type IV pilus assembly protein PilC [Tenuibacillus multivorans]
MASYRYTAVDFYGHAKKGRLEAFNTEQAKKLLRDEGYKVKSIEEVKGSIWTKELYIGRPVKSRDLVVFLQQFSALLKAGLTVVDTIRILREQTNNKALIKALYYIEIDLRQGTSLANAMEKHPKIFNTILVNMIHSAELSGTLEESLDELADYYQKQHKTMQTIQSSLAYPVTVMIVAFLVVIFLLMYVVPQFVSMFDQFGAELPLITRFVLALSNWLVQNWLLFILIISLVILASIWVYQHHQWRYKLDHLLLQLPVFGPLVLKSNIASMTRTLSSLLKNAVPIIQAIELTEKTIPNRVIRDTLKQSKTSLKQGNSFVKPMEEQSVFPFLVTQMISVGENAGSLVAMLEQVSGFYEEDIDTAAGRLKSLLEPLLIIALSIIVGTIVLAIIVPMFDLFNQIN